MNRSVVVMKLDMKVDKLITRNCKNVLFECCFSPVVQFERNIPCSNVKQCLTKTFQVHIKNVSAVHH